MRRRTSCPFRHGSSRSRRCRRTSPAPRAISESVRKAAAREWTMWRNSSSSRAPSSRGPRVRLQGFTLLEAMISLLLLVIVLIVAMTMLFQMRAFAERQQYFMLPRQAARRATDYLSYYIAGASDLNYVITNQPSPNALIMYYNLGTPAFLTQASYNNLTGTETNPGPASNNKPLGASGLRPANTSTAWGDLGTDIITMVAPFTP